MTPSLERLKEIVVVAECAITKDSTRDAAERKLSYSVPMLIEFIDTNDQWLPICAAIIERHLDDLSKSELAAFDKLCTARSYLEHRL